MKVKFLVPEINKEKFNEDFRKLKDIYKFKDKDLSNIGVETLSTESIHRYGKDSIPTMDRLLTLCRYFNITPDKFLSAEPKWIECEVEDVSKLSIIGKTSDTYYVAPMKSALVPVKMTYKTSLKTGYLCLTKGIIYLNEKKEFDSDPSLMYFSDFYLRGRLYSQNKRYRLPVVDMEETQKLINAKLKKYHLYSVNILTNLLGYNQITSVNRLFNDEQKWAGRSPELILKLSWILDIPFEDLLVINYRKIEKDENDKYAFTDSKDNKIFEYLLFYGRSEDESEAYITE